MPTPPTERTEISSLLTASSRSHVSSALQDPSELQDLLERRARKDPVDLPETPESTDAVESLEWYCSTLLFYTHLTSNSRSDLPEPWASQDPSARRARAERTVASSPSPAHQDPRDLPEPKDARERKDPRESPERPTSESRDRREM